MNQAQNEHASRFDTERIAKLESEYEKLSVDYEKLQHDAAEWHAMWQAAERELATHKVRMAAVVEAEQERDAARVYAERLTDVLKRAKSTLEIGRQFASDPVEMVQNWSGHASIVEGMIDEVLAAEGEGRQ